MGLNIGRAQINNPVFNAFPKIFLKIIQMRRTRGGLASKKRTDKRLFLIRDDSKKSW